MGRNPWHGRAECLINTVFPGLRVIVICIILGGKKRAVKGTPVKISGSEVAHVARLARLELNEQEIAGFQKDLNAILEYMDRLKAVDTSGMSPPSYASSAGYALRADERKPSQDLQEALANAPDRKDGAIVVPRVLE